MNTRFSLGLNYTIIFFHKTVLNLFIARHVSSVNEVDPKNTQSSVIMAMSELPILSKLIEMLKLIA